MASPVIAFVPVDPPGAAIYALLGDGFPALESVGGWEIVARPRWIGFTDWVGVAPYTMTIPILLDGLRSNKSVEREVNGLELLVRPNPIPRDRTPLVRMVGSIPRTDLVWVVNRLEITDERRGTHGQRIRVFANVTLLEHVAADVAISSRLSPAGAAAARAAAAVNPHPKPGHPVPSGRPYTVHAGDTLARIAARELGDVNRWTEIASMNQIRDPRSVRIGQVLRLPA